MLTLKVITTNIEGLTETRLFCGDSIKHIESFCEDYSIAKKAFANNSTMWIIGKMTESSSKQKFTISDIEIFDEDRNLKHIMLILPKADCYIMDNGKTIDSFFCQYEQMTAGEVGDNLVDKH